MVDTPRTLAALQALFADNTTGDISPQDLRDFLVSVMGRTKRRQLPLFKESPSGTALPDSDTHGSFDVMPHWDLSDGATHTLNSLLIPVPDDYDGGACNLIVDYLCSTNTGNVRVTWNLREMGNGDAAETSLMNTMEEFAVPGTANTIARRTVSIGTAPTVGKSMAARIFREGAHANDTNSGTLAIMSVWFEYTAAF